jgi:hypothetical protein
MCFGQRFTWTTDCHAIKFILSYDGRNPAILRLQMRFTCWDMYIKHCNDIHLADADYFSRLGSDLCYDPLLHNYIEPIDAIKRDHPSPSVLPIEPQHMPYYRGSRLPKTVPDVVPTVATTLVPTITGSHYLANWPISFGFQLPPWIQPFLSDHFTTLTYQPPPISFGFSASPLDPALPVQSFYNSDLSTTASLPSHFDWAVYGFNSGLFAHSIRACGLPFCIVLAADPFSNGRALFQELTTCLTILSGAPALLDHIRGSGLTSKLTGYLIHLYCYQGSKPTQRFWDFQAHIVTQFRLI